jgi:hypothetical protein
MTVLGAVVFGGLLVLGVLWLLVTAPDSDVDQAWGEPPVTEPGTAPVGAVLTGVR